jgi:hypothetical protein
VIPAPQQRVCSKSGLGDQVRDKSDAETRPGDKFAAQIRVWNKRRRPNLLLDRSDAPAPRGADGDGDCFRARVSAAERSVGRPEPWHPLTTGQKRTRLGPPGGSCPGAPGYRTLPDALAARRACASDFVRRRSARMCVRFRPARLGAHVRLISSGAVRSAARRACASGFVRRGPQRRSARMCVRFRSAPSAAPLLTASVTSAAPLLTASVTVVLARQAAPANAGSSASTASRAVSTRSATSRRAL